MSIQSESILDLWAQGKNATQVKNELNLSCDGTVRSTVAKARKKGDPRALIRQGELTSEQVAARQSFVKVEIVKQESVAVPDDMPTPLLLSLFDLQEDSCRYPIGEPRAPGFGFCGHKAANNLPYCAYHCGLAYAGDVIAEEVFQEPYRPAHPTMSRITGATVLDPYPAAEFLAEEVAA